VNDAMNVPPDLIAFVLAGQVVTWDPVNRWLVVGPTRMQVPRDVNADALIPGHRVLASGHHEPETAAHPNPVWVVTLVRRPGAS
jgi:hypothetical protein